MALRGQTDGTRFCRLLDCTCVYRKLDSAILVVKATENWV